MRALLIVLDSVGVGGAPDAGRYGDEGANTLGHLLEAEPHTRLPALSHLGLAQILDRTPDSPPAASFGTMRERSAGKDSTTGHWELAGVILETPFAVFDHFPPEFVRAIEREADVEFLGNFPASGTKIIEDLGPQHIKTSKPILYTSADSVLQIAAHEQIIPVDHLYDICRIARKHADGYRIGRVIARPFVGEPGSFTRTARRHDFSMKPPRTVLDAIADSGLPVYGIGKIVDLFAGQGMTDALPTESNAHGMQTIDEVWRKMNAGLAFANLVDFDTIFGHRRDPAGYAHALEDFDRWLDGFLPQIGPDDLLIITADHGNDPTFRGTDHTREQVPLLVRYRGRTTNLGQRQSFADVAATLGNFFGLPRGWNVGDSIV